MDTTPTPDPGRALRFQRRHQAPTNELPVPSPVVALLARTDDVAVAVLGLWTFTTGVQFDLAVRVRRVPDGLRSTDLHRAVNGHPDPDAPGPDARLLVGVGFADGRTVDNLTGRLGLARDDDGPTLAVAGSSSGGGGGRPFVLDARCWVTPVPPDGPLTLVVAWPALGVDESVVTLPDLTLATDSGRATVLWPEPEETVSHPAPPRPPELPPGSWFAR